MKSLLFLLVLLISSRVIGAEGTIVTKSQQNFQDTVASIESILTERNFTIFAVIDHSANAATVNRELKPNTLFIFGNPNVGTPIMQNSASAGIDLPVKLHVYKKNGKTWIAYNDPSYLANRHKVSSKLKQLQMMGNALSTIVKEASTQSKN